MDSNDTIKTAGDKMDKSIQVFKKDIATLRAGQANPQILDRILVDYYGVPTPINQLGNISVPEPRQLLISVWDPKMIPEVEKAIQKSDIGINPVNDGKVIRLIVPELTQERRKELVKTLHKKGEEAKVVVRTIRRELNDQLKKMKSSNLLTEDDLKRDEDTVQKMTDAHIKDIEQIVSAKEKEILTV